MTLRADRINYWIFFGDSFGFRLGMSIVSLSTIMPLLLATLGASNLTIGLLSALASLGESLPGTFAAARIRRRPFKKSWLLWAGGAERLFLLSNVAGLLLFARTRPDMAMAWLLVAWPLATMSSGLSIPAYHSMLAKCIPPERRGGMIGAAGAAAGIAGVVAAQAAGVVLVRLAFPFNYAVLFVAAFTVLTATFVTFVWTREPADDVAAADGAGSGAGGSTGGGAGSDAGGGAGSGTGDRFWAFCLQSLRTVSRNKGYMRAAAALAVMAFALMASAFYSTYAVRELGASSLDVARFASITVGVGVVCYPVLGKAADRFGHKRTLEIAALSFAGAAATALSGTLAGIYASLALAGAGATGLVLSQGVIWAEFSPTHAEVPVYISTSMLLMMPFRALAPAMAGWMSDIWGFNTMFCTALAAAVAAFLLLKFAVPEPRRKAR